jgi:hypothetical protein
MWRWLLLLAVTTFVLEAQPSSGVSSRNQDLNFVATQLPRLDTHFFATLSRPAFQQSVNSPQANIARLTDVQFYVALAQLVAMVGHAHQPVSLQCARVSRVTAAFAVAGRWRLRDLNRSGVYACARSPAHRNRGLLNRGGLCSASRLSFRMRTTNGCITWLKFTWPSSRFFKG